MTLGAAAGGVLGGWLVDRAGRKLSLLFCTVPFVTGFAVITMAQDVWVLLWGRFLTGLACGIASLVAPVSVAQPAPWGPGEGADLGAWFSPPPLYLPSLVLVGKEPRLLAPLADDASFRNVKPLVRTQLVSGEAAAEIQDWAPQPGSLLLCK